MSIKSKVDFFNNIINNNTCKKDNINNNVLKQDKRIILMIKFHIGNLLMKKKYI